MTEPNSTASAPISLARHLAPFYYAATSALFFAASSVPTPLYRLYQQAFAFSPILITVIFAVYAFALLASLLIVGSISDHLGRRPVIFVSILLNMVAMLLFLMARGPDWLIAARVVQGLATGAAASSIGAALVDLDPVKGSITNSLAPLTGMAIGALGTSLLVQFAPAPTLLVYIVTLILLILQAVLLWLVPETTRRQSGLLASLKPEVAVPPQVRRTLLALTPINIAVWALAGFYLSLVPSLVSTTTGSTAPLTGGSVVAALTISGAAGVFLLREKSTAMIMKFGIPSMTLGILTVVAGMHAAEVSILGLGTLIAGAGFGATFLGTVRSIMPLAKPDERAGLLSAFYIQSYLAFSLPAILAGFLSKALGFAEAADIYAAAILLLVGWGVLALRAEQEKSVSMS
ncbi:MULTISPECIES: MFS transporter [unclassified Rhizobium]|uniref:MFS transporter n=1 Tax=unclassified Rhizobium TaxID=2613769 RepID=UPI00161986CF|nr:MULTISPECIES: MFS transporter [unclassified Rhizobium]MBB3287567.1 MFS family permease [Rhizobium sp. BK252]MBB3402307.1 MFS family permease [Rhizobium sp. BK289]MBB3414884.1 MFS family permease [Rhizobium sp. BK284]MBB3482773.1 MFS family permease [Rhizobium sp. BK347]MDK4721848.1 MFS transporter [Rhizobium sp. CNPSo 3968]